MIAQIADVSGRKVSRETFEKLEAFVEALKAANQRQNLVSAATLDSIWDRHILDSAQLVRFAPLGQATWIDIGSGGGLPGIVVACLTGGPVTLVEPRRLRAEFLAQTVQALGLNATAVGTKVEKLEGRFDVITARAVAPLDRLLRISHHLSTRKTLWILPKGQSAQSELAETRRTWQGMFHVEQSVTDADSRIIVGTEVRAKRNP